MKGIHMPPQQLPIKFTKNTIRNIHIYHEAAITESVGSGGSITAQFTPTQKQAVLAILKEHNLKASKFIRDMVDIHIELFPYMDKLIRHKEHIINTLKLLR